MGAVNLKIDFFFFNNKIYLGVSGHLEFSSFTNPFQVSIFEKDDRSYQLEPLLNYYLFPLNSSPFFTNFPVDEKEKERGSWKDTVPLKDYASEPMEDNDEPLLK